jgi:hypothetical protein
MAVATFDAPDLNRKPRHMMHYGNAWSGFGTVTLGNSTSGSNARPLRIPAGVLVTDLDIYNDDLDSGGSAAIVCTVGYQPVDGSSPTANATYFAAAAAGTFLGTAGKTRLSFKPIKFEKDVYVNLTVTTAASTFVSGDIIAIGKGQCDGIL